MSAMHPARTRILLLAALCGLSTTAARAGNVTLSGERLALSTTGDAGVTIEVDNGLHGAMRIVGDNLDCLKVQSGQVVDVKMEGCGDDLGHLTLMVPQGYPMSLAIQGSGDVHIGDVNGELTAALNSDATLTVGSAHMLMLAVHGSGDASVSSVQSAADIQVDASGDVKIADLHGMLHGRLNASGDLSIGNIEAPAADLGLAGSGSVTIGNGNIGVLRAQTNGSGDVSVDARVGTADLQASGGGDIKLSGATGTVIRRNASGGSDINVTNGGPNLQDLEGLQQKLDGLKLPAMPPMPPMPPLPPNVKGFDGPNVNINLSDDEWPKHSSGHGVVHFIAGMVVIGLLYVGWRTIQRNGGWQATRARVSPTAETNHPGVMAVRDTLARLDGRLAQVEHYVTSREFDLQRKFRDLDKH